ncbi:ATPase [Clostridia bacterium]|nr:ATPase [Clostridia bacterium]
MGIDHRDDIKTAIASGKAILGIELGSTRIKGVLIDEDHSPIASGSFAWENRHEDGFWTYSTADTWSGIQDCYRDLARNVEAQYGEKLHSFAAIGFSGMMHGYLPFDENGEQLSPFRTWRNTTTGEAAESLTGLLGFNIPQRWSIAHLYQAILNEEKHVPDVRFITTLAGYVHWKLTGKKVVGVGEASGMFPIDSGTGDFDADMKIKFDEVTAKHGFSWKIDDILPEVLTAGAAAGTLTEEGALLIDPSGQLEAGIPLCPPEGDAGTGMAATNSVAEHTGNISAGTSVFAMIVMEQALSKVYPEIDMVTTPSGRPVAMVHCNNCTTDLDAWVSVFGEAAKLWGLEIPKSALYDTLYGIALKGDADCGGLLSYNYHSGEPITHLEEGYPLFLHAQESRFTLANFMRSHLYSAMSTLRIGMDILFEAEHVHVDRLLGHGGFFKTEVVGQRLMAAAMNVPVGVMDTAGEGGPWGVALLAAYMSRKEGEETLEHYLDEKVFAGSNLRSIEPNSDDVSGFASYVKRYKAGLAVETAAVSVRHL